MDQSLPRAPRRAAAEGLAAFALVFAGCGAIIANQQYHDALGAVGISLVFGLIIMVMIYATGHLSGAHINPSVTNAAGLRIDTNRWGGPASRAVGYPSNSGSRGPASANAHWPERSCGAF